MKLFATALMGIAAMLATQTRAIAACDREPHLTPNMHIEAGEPVKTLCFSVQLDRQGTEKRVSLVVENPLKKNLYVTLTGPDGTSIDEFFTGKRIAKFNKVYNFSLAEEGLYSIEVRYGNERIKKQISVEFPVEHPIEKLTIKQ